MAGLPGRPPRDHPNRRPPGLHRGHLRRPPRPTDSAAHAGRYPFGYGLGYTTWEYVDLKTTGHPTLDPDPDATFTVHVTVRNSGPRHGREVVQVYASRPDSTIPRPPHWLAGFAIADAGPGETATVEVVVNARTLAHWDVGSGAWRIEPGSFILTAGLRDTALSAGVPPRAPSSIGTPREREPSGDL